MFVRSIQCVDKYKDIHLSSRCRKINIVCCFSFHVFNNCLIFLCRRHRFYSSYLFASSTLYKQKIFVLSNNIKKNILFFVSLLHSTKQNKLHFFTLLLLLAYSRAAEDYNSKQKIKESDIIKVVPVSSDNKYQHQNKRGVSDISEDIVLGTVCRLFRFFYLFFVCNCH